MQTTRHAVHLPYTHAELSAIFDYARALLPFPEGGLGITLFIHLPFIEDGHAVETGQFR